MGASLDTPARCPLCQEMTRDPVTLRCDHRFCRRCLGDLWSVAPDGPYHCPEWRCKTVYQTLPFDRSLIRTPPRGQGPQPRSAAASCSNGDRSDSLRRPSLASKLLGKRKASTPVPEQPDPKRSTVDRPRERPTETPTSSSTSSTSTTSTPTSSSSTSSSEKPGRSAGVETPKKASQPESTRSEGGDTSSSSVKKEAPDPQPVEKRVEKPVEKRAEVVSLDDSDSSNEVDICDAPPPPPDPAHQSPPNTPGSPTRPAGPPQAASGPSGPSGVFSRPEKKNCPVPCHYCPKAGQQPAVKTCLVCGASMCTEHLRPHLEAPVFQNHTLVPPVDDISPWRCQEHQEINRIYCRQCSACVCTVCTVIGSHRDHACISIREAERELRGNLKEEIRQLQNAEQQVKNRVSELTQKTETFRVVLSEARDGVRQQYGAIREALEQEEQSALGCVTQEESRVLGRLEEELGRLRSSLLSVQQGLHTLEGLADTRGDKRIQDQAFITEYSKVAQLAGRVGGCVQHFDPPEEVDRARLGCLQRWSERRLDSVIIAVPGRDGDLYRLLYGTVPVLDPDTAHPKLQLSEGNRKVTYSEAPQFYPEHPSRFTSFPQVLGAAPLEAGRWYWEVGVSQDEGRWKVGLSEGRIERKGQRDGSRLGFNGFSWCLACDRRKLEALHNKVSVPVEVGGAGAGAGVPLQRVGVFLDFDEGTLSFFSVAPGGSLTLMHSFEHRFSEPLFPALSASKTQLLVCDLFQS